MSACISVDVKTYGYKYICCKGVVFQTIKSSVHAWVASPQTEKTTSEAFLNILFDKSDLQNIVIQFTP